MKFERSELGALFSKLRTAVPEGASFLLQWWYSMTSASGK